MTRSLGIDTGGTFTDAAILDDVHGVVAAAKSLTTRDDLAVGIAAAIRAVHARSPGPVDLVSISTTLATNAIVEGVGFPVGLILIGQEPTALDRAGLREALGADPVAFVEGGHDPFANERRPFDAAAAETAIRSLAPGVQAFAVCGHFAVANPAHELRVAGLVADLTDKPVTCSHELSSRLDAPRRAVTALLNARLLPLITRLIDAVRLCLRREKIDAPLMIVKGDGSLVDASFAAARPVETILSGPAASVVGARFLAGLDDMIVADMGGTTTDVALVRAGRPAVDSRGARVGGWRTMVEAVDVRSIGLGGDSEVSFDAGRIALGPRRVVPLALAASEHPEILAALDAAPSKSASGTDGGQFALLTAHGRDSMATANRIERALLEGLAGGPRRLSDLLQDRVDARALERMAAHDRVRIAGLTPSDAAHVLGLHDEWSVEAARAAVRAWRAIALVEARLACDDDEAFAERIVEAVRVAAGRVVVECALEPAGLAADAASASLIDNALDGIDDRNALLRVQLHLDVPLVAVGAPAATYFPEVGRRLHSRLEVPAHAEVANAVGAVAARVVQNADVVVTTPEEAVHRVQGGEDIRDFSDLDAALAHAESVARALALDRARAAGATDITVEVTREAREAARDDGHVMHIETRIRATAFGNPSMLGDAAEPATTPG